MTTEETTLVRSLLARFEVALDANLAGLRVPALTPTTNGDHTS